MKNAQILHQIHSGRWAITEQAFKGILSFTQRDFSGISREIFHAAAIDEKPRLISGFGNPVAGQWDTYIKGNVGMFFVDGPIIPRAELLSEISGMISLETLTSRFKQLESNESVDTILMLMDCPGGFLTGTDEFSQLVAKSKKKTIAYGYGQISSAAYWIASATDEIILAKTAYAGSIGVVITILEDSKKLEMEGIEHIDIVSSQSPDKRLDVTKNKDKAKLQAHVDQMGEIFIDTVATNRGVSKETVLNDFGKGMVKIGEEAVKSKMADSVSSLDSLILKLTGEEEKTPQVNNNSTNGGSMPEEVKNKTTPKGDATAKPMVITPAQPETAAEAMARIQGCEGLLSALGTGCSAQAKAAAREYISAHKYDEGATAQSLAGEVMKIVTSGKVDPAAASAEAARKLAEETAGIPATDTEKGGTDTDLEGNEEADSQTISNMVASMKETPQTL